MTVWYSASSRSGHAPAMYAASTFSQCVAFSPAFLAGAGVLLASYDDEQTAIAIAAPVVTTTPAPVEAPASTVR